MTRSRSRSRRTLAVLVSALALGLSACGAGSTDDPAEGPAPSVSTGATITHRFGTTVVPSNPTKVVTVGFNEQDYAIALGAEPVGTGWLTAVREKRYIDLGAFDQDFAAALGFNSPLSLPFVLTEAEPRLVAATDGDPATAPEPFPAA